MKGLSGAKRWLESPQLERKHIEQTDWMTNVLVDYNRTFGDHTFGGTFGVEAQKKHYEETYAFRKGFISDSKPELNLGGEEGIQANGYSWNESRLNYFGRFSYNYLERYLLEFVCRKQWLFIAFMVVVYGLVWILKTSILYLTGFGTRRLMNAGETW